MHLTVLSNLYTQVFLLVEGLTVHDCFGAQSFRHSTLRREEIEKLHGMYHNVNRQELCNSLKWKAMSICSKHFLHHPDSTFDLRDMLVGFCQVNHGTTW